MKSLELLWLNDRLLLTARTCVGTRTFMPSIWPSKQSKMDLFPRKSSKLVCGGRPVLEWHEGKARVKGAFSMAEPKEKRAAALNTQEVIGKASATEREPNS